MASDDQLRAWWAPYLCRKGPFVKVSFPGVSREWELSVAAPSQPVWEAFAEVMRVESYFFREAAGGTYNCRKIDGTNNWSLHAFGIAIDLNPSKNPQGRPLRTDMPLSFRQRVGTITANGKRAFEWGGSWSIPDAMHFELDIAPADCKNVTWDKPEPPTIEDNMLPLEATSAKEDIRSLQNRLNIAYSTGLSLDGVWGPSTIAAVKTHLSGLSGDPNANAGKRVVARQWDHLLQEMIRKTGGGGPGLSEAQVKAIVNQSRIVAPG